MTKLFPRSRPGERALLGGGERRGKGLLGSNEGGALPEVPPHSVNRPTLHTLGCRRGTGGLRPMVISGPSRASQARTLPSAHRGGCSAKGGPAAGSRAREGHSLPPGWTALEGPAGKEQPLPRLGGRSGSPHNAHSSPGALIMPLCASQPWASPFIPTSGVLPKPLQPGILARVPESRVLTRANQCLHLSPPVRIPCSPTVQSP